ncbi:hypothetical protein SD436_07090 [Streptococcus sp. 2A/TPW/M5]
MTIYIKDGVSVKEQDLKAAAKKLDASKLPDGAYDFYYSKGSYADSISYSFKVKDGKVVFMKIKRESRRPKLKKDPTYLIRTLVNLIIQYFIGSQDLTSGSFIFD